MSKIKTRLSKTPLLMRVVSLYLVIVFVVLIFIKTSSVIVEANAPVIPNHRADSPIIVGDINEKIIIDGYPQTFRVDRLSINMPIVDGVYNNSTGEWSLSEDAVYYIPTTSLPNNQRGSTFIYGHNRDKVIAKLSDLVEGDIATIITANGHGFYYSYTGDKTVPANYMEVLSEDSDTPRLTVMTCEGLWSQMRRIMYFELVEAI